MFSVMYIALASHAATLTNHPIAALAGSRLPVVDRFSGNERMRNSGRGTGKITVRGKFERFALLWWYLAVANKWIFFRESMRCWMETGSVFPTGLAWRKKAIAAAFAHCPRAGLIAIHGIGCGELLVSILTHIRKRNLRVREVLVMDTNPRFITHTEKVIRLMRDLGKCRTKIRFVCMDAMHSEKYLREEKLSNPDIVFGMIPYTNMPRKLEQWVQLYARITKHFVCMSYIKMAKRPSAQEATNRLMGLLGEHFPSVERGLVLWNVPPVYCIISSKDGRYGKTALR